MQRVGNMPKAAPSPLERKTPGAISFAPIRLYFRAADAGGPDCPQSLAAGAAEPS